MNPQQRYDRNLGVFINIEAQIYNFLTTNRGKEYSSHELYNNIQNSSDCILLFNSLKNYTKPSGFREVSSHIGAIASDMAARGMIQHTHKICPILNRIDDSFKL
ncbi:hypothetical protein [Clostridium butyricum]|uniref:hypothetical protein n=1 Tax=Clostridium butyricum TaxID=1492 RepID=UPI003467A7DD